MSETTADDRMLRKIQALLDKAESTEYGPERDALREKADALMVKYTVEQYQLEELRRARGESVSLRPVTRDLVVPWMSNGFAQYTYDLLLDLTVAVGVRTLYRGWDRNADGKTGWKITLVGYEVDVRYVEMLFYSLRLQMLKMLEPEPSASLSFDANVFSMHDAGIKWQEIARQMNKHVQITFKDANIPSYCKGGQPIMEKRDVDRYVAEQSGPWEYTPWPDGGRLIRAYRRECARQGVQAVAVMSAESYQRSFASSFASRIKVRLLKTRSNAETGLVLKRKQEEVDDLWKSLLPPPPEKTEEDDKKRKRVAKYKEPRWDAAGHLAGERAADKADLSRLEERVDSNKRGALR